MARTFQQLVNRSEYFSIHHIPRRYGGVDRLGVFPDVRPVDDTQADRAQMRAGSAYRRPANPPRQKRHADDGRFADSDRHYRVHPVVGQLGEPVYLDSLGRTACHRCARFYDDWRKVVYKDPNGVSAKFKMVWQSSVAVIAGLALFYLAANSANNILIVPFFKQIALPLGVVGFLVLSYLTIVGTSNAVNLTDGLDGLAAFPVVLVAAGLAIFAYVSGHYQFSQYLQLPYVAGANEVAIFCTAMCGACLGFLWFNAYPAQVFMGDVGALALGAALGTVAVIVRQEFVLVIMGGLFVVEAVSVMLQVGWYKKTKKRIFLMAPIHHHYEQKGWKETQVVVRFWIITIVLVLIGLSTLKIR